MNLIFAPD
uniref:Uncharacterized protein n=1 Tax=Rhizophora mucronata TaxID=61149 RepID=A0A2P2PAZ0_RHIMU